MGLWQCIAAVPSVYDVTIPPSLDAYLVWFNLLEFPVYFGFDIALPPSCLGSYRQCALLCPSLFLALSLLTLMLLL